jgi:hypothetical protein
MWGGPGHFRFYFQPLVAIFLGLREGIADARAGRKPFGLYLFERRASFTHRFVGLVKHLAVPLAVAVAVSWVFQVIITGRIHPLASLLYATVFVALPYVVSRALSNRATRGQAPPPGAGWGTSMKSR